MIYPFDDVFEFNGQECQITADYPYTESCGCCPLPGFAADILLEDGTRLTRIDWQDLKHCPEHPMSLENRVRAAGWRDMEDYEVIYETRRDFRWPDSAHLNDIPLKSFWESLPKP
jgi:hypothetical protein